MNWYQGTMLLLGMISVLGLPVALVKAIAAKNLFRVLKVAISGIVMTYLVVHAFVPTFLHTVSPMLHLGLLLLLTAVVWPERHQTPVSTMQ